MEELQVVKAIAEVRFPNAPMFVGRRADVVHAFVNRFEVFSQWRIGDQGCAIFDDEKSKMHYAVAKVNLAAVLVAFPDSPDQFLNYAGRFYEVVRANFKIRQLDSIELHLALVGAFDGRDEMLDFFASRVFDRTASAWAEMGTATDFGVAVDTEVDGNEVKTSFGPMLRDQYADRLDLSRDHIDEQYWQRIPEHSYLVHMRFGATGTQVGVDAKSVVAFWTTAWDECMRRSSAFISRLEADK